MTPFPCILWDFPPPPTPRLAPGGVTAADRRRFWGGGGGKQRDKQSRKPKIQFSNPQPRGGGLPAGARGLLSVQVAVPGATLHRGGEGGGLWGRGVVVLGFWKSFGERGGTVLPLSHRGAASAGPAQPLASSSLELRSPSPQIQRGFWGPFFWGGGPGGSGVPPPPSPTLPPRCPTASWGSPRFRRLLPELCQRFGGRGGLFWGPGPTRPHPRGAGGARPGPGIRGFRLPAW